MKSPDMPGFPGEVATNLAGCPMGQRESQRNYSSKSQQ
jgi:hypothetical protein